MVATSLFVSGSMRARRPFLLVAIHTLPSPVVTPPSESAGPATIRATIFPVFESTRSQAYAPQLGTHTLPNPDASPEQGLSMLTIRLVRFVTGSSRTT